MANPSSYTEQDLKKIDQYFEKYPDAWGWTTLEGLKVPLALIKDDHLKNILKHIDRHPTHYNQSIRHIIWKEVNRRFLKTPAGKVLFG